MSKAEGGRGRGRQRGGEMEDEEVYMGAVLYGVYFREQSNQINGWVTIVGMRLGNPARVK